MPIKSQPRFYCELKLKPWVRPKCRWYCFE